MANGEGKKREGTECGLRIVFPAPWQPVYSRALRSLRSPGFSATVLHLSSPNQRNNRTALISAAGHRHSLVGNGFFQMYKHNGGKAHFCHLHSQYICSFCLLLIIINRFGSWLSEWSESAVSTAIVRLTSWLSSNYLALCSFSLASTAYVALDKKSQIVP